MTADEQRKAALSRLVEDFKDATAMAVWQESPSIRSTSVFYALINPLRPNRPNDAQLIAIAAFARRLAARIIACAEGIEACIPNRRTGGDASEAQSYHEPSTPVPSSRR